MKKYQAGPLDDYVDRQAAPQPVEPPTQQARHSPLIAWERDRGRA